MKNRSKLLAVVCATVLSMSCVTPAFACTPKLNPPSVKIPDANFEPDDALKEAFDNAAKKWLEKCVLATPVVKYASYYKSASRYFNYTYVAVKWSEVENATSYKLRITKADGSYKEFDTTYTSFYAMNYTDEFFADGMDDATVMVRAYGENGTFSLLSKTTTITRFRY